MKQLNQMTLLVVAISVFLTHAIDAYVIDASPELNSVNHFRTDTEPLAIDIHKIWEQLRDVNVDVISAAEDGMIFANQLHRESGSITYSYVTGNVDADETEEESKAMAPIDKIFDGVIIEYNRFRKFFRGQLVQHEALIKNVTALAENIKHFEKRCFDLLHQFLTTNEKSYHDQIFPTQAKLQAEKTNYQIAFDSNAKLEEEMVITMKTIREKTLAAMNILNNLHQSLGGDQHLAASPYGLPQQIPVSHNRS